MNDYKHIAPGHHARRQYQKLVRREVIGVALAVAVMLATVSLIVRFADFIDAWPGV
jgi:hypothetical protein